MAMLPPPTTKPIALPRQRGFSRGGKQEEYAKPRTEGREMSYGKIGLTTVAVTHDLLSGMPLVVLRKELISLWNFGTLYYLNQDNPVPNCSNSYASLNAISRWYRIVYIHWLVASYDTHKNKHWLNSDPSTHKGII